MIENGNIRELIARARAAGVNLQLGLIAENKELFPAQLRAELAGRKSEIISLLAGDMMRRPPAPSPQAKTTKEQPKRGISVLRRDKPILLRARPKQWEPAADEPIKGDFCAVCREQAFVECAGHSGWMCDRCGPISLREWVIDRIFWCD